jgi:hypothetical protein
VAVDTPEDVGLVPDQRGGTGGEVETAPYQSRGHALVPALPRSTNQRSLEEGTVQVLHHEGVEVEARAGQSQGPCLQAKLSDKQQLLFLFVT